MRHIVSVIALLVGGATVGGALEAGSAWAEARARESEGLVPEEAVVELAPGQRVFSLGRAFVFVGSLSLSVDGRSLEEGKDYLVDLTSGTVYLKRGFAQAAAVRAAFKFLPFELKTSYVAPVSIRRDFPGMGFSARAKGSSGAGNGAGSVAGSGKPPGAQRAEYPGGPYGADSWAGSGGGAVKGSEGAPDFAAEHGRSGSGGRPSLTVGGSKRLAVEFGTGRDVAMSQSLDLDITGRVGRDVELKAILSDRNLPLLPEGNTQTLEELDEVLIKVTSPNVQATFGDYTIAGPHSEFAHFTRSVEGVQATAKRGDQQVTIATASSRGKFASAEFVGEEGKQGTYYVTGSAGGPVTLVPGGEKVWLDGELMRRGATADYVIDYGSGAITFTSRRPITKDSRITVDYEYSHDAYRRSLTSAVGRTRSGPLSLTASYAVERDDSGSDLGGELTDEDRVRLEGIGDGAGDAASADSAGGGAAGVPLRPPSSHELLDLGLGYAFWEGFSLEGEVALSDLDLNTLSGRDDGDNKGTALSLKAGLAPKGLGLSGRSLGTLEGTASFRETGSTFAAMGRTRPAMDYDRWGLAPGGSPRGEGRAELSLTYRPHERVAFGTEMGHLAVRGSSRSQVMRFVSSVSGRRGCLFRWERAETQALGEMPDKSQRDRALTQLRWAAGPLAPSFQVETERRSSSGGTGSDWAEVGGEIAASGRGATTRAALYVREDFGGLHGARVRQSRSLTQSYGFSYRGRSRAGLEGRYSLRTLAVDSTRARVNTYVAHMDGLGSALDGALGCRGTYEVTSTDEGPRTVVFVGPGKGHYDADGRYVGLGDYEVSDEDGPGPLSSRVTLSFNTDLDWGRAPRSRSGGTLDKVLSSIRSSATYRSEEHTRLPVAAPSLILHPSSYMNERHIIRGSSVARGDLELLPRGRLISPRVRYEVRRKLQNRDGDGASGTALRLVALRLRTRALPRGTLEAEQIWGRSSTQGSYTQAGPRRTSETKATFTLRAGPRTSFALRSSLMSETSPEAGGGSRWELEPSATYSSPGRAGVEARCSWARADRDGSRSYDELLGWLGDRVEYSLSGQLGLGGGMTLTGTLRGTGVTWDELSHYLRMEMRALF